MTVALTHNHLRGHIQRCTDFGVDLQIDKAKQEIAAETNQKRKREPTLTTHCQLFTTHHDSFVAETTAEPEVTHFDDGVGGDEDVRWLQVAVQYTVAMHVSGHKYNEKKKKKQKKS